MLFFILYQCHVNAILYLISMSYICYITSYINVIFMLFYILYQCHIYVTLHKTQCPFTP